MRERTSWPRRHRLLTTALAVLIVTVAVGGGWVLTQRNRTTHVELTDVLSRYRQQTSSTTEASTQTAPGATPRPTPTVEDVAAGDGVTPRTAGEPTAAPVSPAVRGASAAALTTPVRYQRPAEGVYTYLASGRESISVAGANHDYPDRSYGTVTHRAGCEWELHVDVIKEHSDDALLCSEPGRVLQLEQGRTVEFFGKRDGVRNRCEPPQLFHAVGEAVGTVTVVQCGDGNGNHAEMKRTYLGTETVEVASAPIAVEHVRLDGTFTGKATGTSVDHLWLLPSTGLIVRWARTVDTKADAAFGAQVTYKENADFILESLEPRT